MSLEITIPKKQNTAITKAPRPNPEPDSESFLLAMYLMFARCPRAPDPDIDGHFNLGEIGEAPEKAWERLTPYSLARRAK
jgi:hypothetical protein